MNTVNTQNGIEIQGNYPIQEWLNELHKMNILSTCNPGKELSEEELLGAISAIENCSEWGEDYYTGYTGYRNNGTCGECGVITRGGTCPSSSEDGWYTHPGHDSDRGTLVLQDIIGSLNMISRPILNQRYNLLSLNPDLLFGVYHINEGDEKGYNLSIINKVLTCYPNQLKNLKGLEENSDITIVNLGSLRKGKIEVISGEDDFDIQSPVLLSNGVLDYVESYSFLRPAKELYKKILDLSTQILVAQLNDEEYCSIIIEKKDEMLNFLSNATDGDVIGLMGTIIEANEIGLSESEELDQLIDTLTTLLAKVKTNKHFVTTLRDGGAADDSMRTTAAGRNTGEDLNEEIEVELMGEAPFLGKNKQGEYVLAVHDLSFEKIIHLEEAVENFIKSKHLSRGDEHYNEKKKLFERNFKGVNYDNLSTILVDIIESKRFVKYDLLDGEISGTKNGVKNITLGNSSGDYYIHHDYDNNTIEYRAIKKIGNFDENFIPLGNRPGRLYLESKNQYPRVPKILNAGMNRGNSAQLVPTVQSVVDNIIRKDLKILIDDLESINDVKNMSLRLDNGLVIPETLFNCVENKILEKFYTIRSKDLHFFFSKVYGIDKYDPDSDLDLTEKGFSIDQRAVMNGIFGESKFHRECPGIMKLYNKKWDIISVKK